jgi:hypothetical protein
MRRRVQPGKGKLRSLCSPLPVLPLWRFFHGVKKQYLILLFSKKFTGGIA